MLFTTTPVLRHVPAVMIGPNPEAKNNRCDNPALIQGGSILAGTYRSSCLKRVQVDLWSEGRPMDADIELWNGPINTPSKLRIYTENGKILPFRGVLETPVGPNTVAIRNIGTIEHPITAKISAKGIPVPHVESADFVVIQGGGLCTYPFNSTVDNTDVMLMTDGGPLNARIEILQGPNNNKQVVELYTENGFTRPFFCTLATPGSGHVVRVVNTAPVEFPMTATVVPRDKPLV